MTRWLILTGSLQIHAYLKNKPSIENAEAVLTWSPPPVAVPGLARFTEGVRAARLWLARLEGLAQDKSPVTLQTLEALASEGQRLPVALPQLKVNTCCLQSFTRCAASKGACTVC